jgi:hypothetical protein
MGKSIKLTESELINIIKKIVFNRPVISEEDNVKDFDNTLTQTNNDKFLDKFESDDIKEALKIAFKDYWVKGTGELYAGLRGIESIGDYLKKQKGYNGDTSETWSVMNFFNTRTIQKLINAKWEKEYKGWEGDKVEWLVDIFKNNNKFLQELLDTQWGSVYQGFYKNEPAAIKNLKNVFKTPNTKFKTYSFGHKKDINGGVDVEIDMPGITPFTIQIKPVTKTEELTNGYTKVYTDGMSDDYKLKIGLNFILYNKGENFIMFRNKNYDVIPSSEGKEVIHREKPLGIYRAPKPQI